MSKIVLSVPPSQPALVLHPSHLASAFDALTSEGWRHTALQLVFPGQYYGLVIAAGDGTEFHMRAYVNGMMDAHWELSREYFEHLSWPSIDVTGYLEDVLVRWRIPYEVVGHPQRPASYDLPSSMTPWMPWAGAAVLFGLFVLASRGSGDASRDVGAAV